MAEEISAQGARGIFVSLALAVIALFAGVPQAVVELSKDNVPHMTCTTYWSEIGTLSSEGLSETFWNMDEPELENRCGQAHDVAQDFLEESEDR